MKDALWRAVYYALHPLLDDTDVILAPRGDWPPFPCCSLHYDDLVEVTDATVLILHKGQLTSLPKSELRRIANEWQWIFANEVFIVLTRSGENKNRHSPRPRDRPPPSAQSLSLLGFAAQAAFQNRLRAYSKDWRHIDVGRADPGISITCLLPEYSRVFAPSPGAGGLRLIALHFSPSFLLPSLAEDDWIIGMVRDPTQRFLSGVMHSRRTAADPETFTLSARAMREMDLTEYLATDFGRYEARLQLITFGTDPRQLSNTTSDEEMLRSAVSFARRGNVILAPSERSLAFSVPGRNACRFDQVR